MSTYTDSTQVRISIVKARCAIASNHAFLEFDGSISDICAGNKVEKQVAVSRNHCEVGVPCLRNLREETLLKIALVLNMFN
jgi:hypothetical protein